MERVYTSGQMVASMKETTRKIRRRAMASTLTQMEDHTRAIGSMGNSMVKVYLFLHKGRTEKGYGKQVNGCSGLMKLTTNDGCL